MPVYESCCPFVECDRYCVRLEWYAPRIDTPDPLCDLCGKRTQRMVSNFNAPFTGTLDRFDEPGHETQNKHDGGHLAYRVHSSRLADGSPEPVAIRTRQDQREYCRAEGLVDPSDVNPNLQINSDGRSTATSGITGQWAGTPATMPQEFKKETKEKPVFGGLW